MLSQEAKNFLEKNKHKRIVFTNGCFDILHVGHVSYLKDARDQGDVLFLGLNSDQSVKRLKGNDRPINNQRDRKLILESLRWIDFVEIFEEDTPLRLITEVSPRVLVKGGDYAVTEIVGSSHVLKTGGQVLSLNFHKGYSTTHLIQKINE